MPRVNDLLLRDVDIEGRRCDISITAGLITAIGDSSSSPDPPRCDVLEGHGGAVVPGLHDHHVHLLAMAAAAESVSVAPGDTRDAEALGRALRDRAEMVGPGAWVRAIAYDDAVAGPLDRWRLDELVGDRPVRVQHRSGVQWVLNSAACRAVGLDDAPPSGAGRDAEGRLDGRLIREDPWLASRLAPSPPPDVEAVVRRLHRAGITGVTDATPFTRTPDLDALRPAAGLIRLQVMGSPALTKSTFDAPLRQGPVKFLLDEHDLPALEDLADGIATAHRAGRAVGIHVVTRATLVLALAAWEHAGTIDGDRVEHGAVLPDELIPAMRRFGLTVVTQPLFIADRGDAYLHRVDSDDIPHLYRCGSLIAAGVRVAASSDAPYAAADPWQAIQAAVTRTTLTGVVVGEGERLTARQALDLFLAPLDTPGGEPRRVVIGAAADLVVLDAPLDDVLRSPSSERVIHTLVGGRPVLETREPR